MPCGCLDYPNRASPLFWPHRWTSRSSASNSSRGGQVFALPKPSAGRAAPNPSRRQPSITAARSSDLEPIGTSVPSSVQAGWRTRRCSAGATRVSWVTRVSLVAQWYAPGMTVPRRKLRAICVDGWELRWMFRVPRCGGCTQHEAWVLVTSASRTGMVVRSQLAMSYVHNRVSEPVTPAHVATLARHALRQGWLPGRGKGEFPLR